MKKEEITGIVVRLFALAIAFYSIRHLPGMAISLSSTGNDDAIFFYGLALFMSLIGCFLLWKYPLYIANKIIPRSNPTSENGKWKIE